MSQLYSTGARVVFQSVDSTATSASYAAGFTTTLPNDSFPMGGSPSGERYRAVKIILLSEGTGATVDARVWAFWPCVTDDASGYEAQCLATITSTGSTAVTLPSDYPGVLARYCSDTIAVTTTTTATTPKGPGSVLNTALGSPGAQAFSPSDNATPGFVIIPDCGNPSHIYVEIWDAGGDRCNGFIEGLV